MRQEINATAAPNDFDLLEDWVEVKYLDTRKIPDPAFEQVSDTIPNPDFAGFVPETIPNPAFDPENPTNPPEPQNISNPDFPGPSETLPNPDFPEDVPLIDEEFYVETAEFRALLKSDGTVKTGENYGKIIARVRSGMDLRTGKTAPPTPTHPLPKRADQAVTIP